MTKQFIRKARTILGCTVDRFAELVDVSPRTIYRWENGENSATGDFVLVIIKLCMEQGIDIKDLVSFLYWIKL